MAQEINLEIDRSVLGDLLANAGTVSAWDYNTALGDNIKEVDEKDKESYSLLEELSALKLKYLKSEREKTLMSLESEGCMFSVSDELTDTLDLNDEQFDKHLNRIRKFSQKAPIAQKFSVATLPSGGVPTSSVDMNEIEKIKAHALKNQITFQQAYTQVKGN